MTTHRKSTRRSISTAFGFNLGVNLTIASALVFLFIGVPALTSNVSGPDLPDAPGETFTLSPVPTRVDRLLERNECWTDGDAPADVIPGHAIVTLPGDVAKKVDSSVGFEIWLGADEVPGSGDERPGTLHAFCP